MNQMLKQVQQMQAEMVKAQEELKDEIVEASAGGGMVTVKVTGELEVKEIRSTPRRSIPRTSRLLQDMVLAAVNEALRSAQELAAIEDERRDRRPRRRGGLGGLGLPGLGASAARRYAAMLCSPRRSTALITELARLPGIGQRTAQRLAFHILRVSDEEALALADAIREVKETVGHCEICFNLAVGRPAASARTRAATRR